MLARRFTLLLVALSLGCAGSRVLDHGVPNLVQVRPDVYRSGQPTTAEGWDYLRTLGVRHVVKLNFADEGSDDGAAAAGIAVHDVAVQPSTRGIDVWSAPSPARMAELLALVERVRDAGGREGSWLIHCQNGHDRTGLVVGMVRIVADGWEPRRAWDEMIARGYHAALPGLDWAFYEFVRGLPAKK